MYSGDDEDKKKMCQETPGICTYYIDEQQFKFNDKLDKLRKQGKVTSGKKEIQLVEPFYGQSLEFVYEGDVEDGKCYGSGVATCKDEFDEVF